jgi:L-ascorbate metabolism protein UlaG (beta-lactamase superfamily)
MLAEAAQLTYIGGPTALLEWAGLRFLTDPTFDSAGEIYELPAYTLRKTQGPALTPDDIGGVDAVLLSHGHHFDNLDRAGRDFLIRARQVFTTIAGADRLGGNAVGLAPWEARVLAAQKGGALRVRATPARHGPPDADRGPVLGFALDFPDTSADTIYVSGDTVWYEGVEQVAAKCLVKVAVLFVGAARVRAAGDWPLTFTAEGAVAAARSMPQRQLPRQ